MLPDIKTPGVYSGDEVKTFNASTIWFLPIP